MVIEVVNVNVRMTYSIVIVGRLSQSVGDGDASGRVHAWRHFRDLTAFGGVDASSIGHSCILFLNI